MSSDEEDDDKDGKQEKERKSHASHAKPRVLLVPYPKFVFMYPTLIVSLVCWITMAIAGTNVADPSESMPVVMTGIFLGVMCLNMFVIVFDFPRATSLTLVFLISTFFLGMWIAIGMNPNLLPAIGSWVAAVRPVANTAFFGCITVAMIVVYLAVFVSVRFNYWELRNNELLHHHGLLSDLKRYPAPNLRVDKEINDVFEFLLLGAGRLILHPTTEKRAIVLDNVIRVGDKEKRLTRMLGSIKVKIGDDSNS